MEITTDLQELGSDCLNAKYNNTGIKARSMGPFGCNEQYEFDRFLSL